MPAPIRAVAYYRMSTDKQEDSIDRQRSQVEPYARKQGYELAGDYADEGIAGDEFDRRSAFQRLLRDAAAGRFSVILVDEPSRLSRQNPVELIEKVIAPLRRARVKIATASKGPLDYDTLAGLIMMTVHAHKSSEESIDLSRRVLSGIVRKAKEGKWFGWMAPYGLRVVRDMDPESGKILSRKCVFGPDEEVCAVRLMFDLVANRGWSLRSVCRELEARGLKPPAGNGWGGNKEAGRWNSGTVRKMLKNRKYVGDSPWNETTQGKYSTWDEDSGEARQSGEINRRSGRNAEANVIVVPDVIPPIIDRATFARAAAVLTHARQRTSSRGGEGSYLFTHMLVCGDCGAFLRGQPIRGRKSYICAKYKEYGTQACSRNTTLESTLLEAILGTLLDDILNPTRLEDIEAEMERQLTTERASGEADRLRQRIAALERNIAQGNANLACLPPDRLPGVIVQVRAWDGERAGLLARLDELENGAAQSKAILAEARKQLWRLREALLSGDTEAQGTVIREVISKVEVRFTHERTHGRRSPTGRKRKLSRPAGAVVYVRPGLGLSCLVIPDC